NSRTVFRAFKPFWRHRTWARLWSTATNIAERIYATFPTFGRYLNAAPVSYPGWESLFWLARPRGSATPERCARGPISETLKNLPAFPFQRKLNTLWPRF